MKIEQWQSLTGGEKIICGVYSVTVEERDGKIGWEDADGVWFERGHYNLMMWEMMS